MRENVLRRADFSHLAGIHDDQTVCNVPWLASLSGSLRSFGNANRCAGMLFRLRVLTVANALPPAILIVAEKKGPIPLIGPLPHRSQRSD
jgi:hypothetical protein